MVRAWANRKLRSQIQRVERHLSSLESEDKDQDPILIFNASTRIHTLSLNAAFSLLAAWGLRARGIPVRYIVCRQAMQQCILGTDRRDLEKEPPCRPCIRFSRILFPQELSRWLTPEPSIFHQVDSELEKLDVSRLMSWTYQGYPLGQLCLPGLRWALRRHDLPEDPAVRDLYHKYLSSAAGLVSQFDRLFEKENPRALLVFNGITYPEAVARAVAERRGIPTVTHEVGLQPQSAYFSHEEATFRQVPLPANYELSEAEQAQLDRYLERRRKGQFSMAGVEFWPQMKALPEVIRKEMERYEQMVAVFTNVIFDTSQVHANVIFDDMFSWLDSLSEVIKQHPETLFVLRAHPDENRPGKEAVQSVAAWFEASGLAAIDNVLFYSPDEFVSSYHLIEAAHLVLVYNSSIGLEASIMGAPVLSAGRARFTAADTVFMPESRQSYLNTVNSFLTEKSLSAPEDHARNSRRFLFRELHEASLDFSEYLSPYPEIQGMVTFKPFAPHSLTTDKAFDVIKTGLLEGKSFLVTRPRVFDREAV